MTNKLDTESLALSKLGRNLILLMAVTEKWKAVIADVKVAFLEADVIVVNE